MHRAYCPIESFPLNTTVNLTDTEEIHHIKNVLCLKPGEQVQLFNGKGEEAVGILSTITEKSISILMQNVLPETPKSIRVVLACAIPKKVKFDSIVEKATELGVDEIIPLLTGRTEIRLDEKRSAGKHTRYETIALNAAKQCKRSSIPAIHPPTPFSKAIQKIDPHTLGLIPCLEAPNRISLNDAFARSHNTATVMVFIGPEGDFTDEEIQHALNAGCLPVTLGSTILKVDTAALCVLSAARVFFQL